MTTDDLAAAVEKEPLLTTGGIEPDDGYRKRQPRKVAFREARSVLKTQLDQFRMCCEWLSGCKRTARINPDVGTSYSLRHRVEWHYGAEITNGAFIAAVIHLGIPYSHVPGGPHISVALSSKLPPREPGFFKEDQPSGWGAITNRRKRGSSGKVQENHRY